VHTCLNSGHALLFTTLHFMGWKANSEIDVTVIVLGIISIAAMRDQLILLFIVFHKHFSRKAMDIDNPVILVKERKSLYTGQGVQRLSEMTDIGLFMPCTNEKVTTVKQFINGTYYSCPFINFGLDNRMHLRLQ
jgi:hypothetical protein